MTEKVRQRREKVTNLPKEAQEILCKQIINLRLTGATQADTAKQLGIPVSSVKTLEASDLHQELLVGVSDDLSMIIAKTRCDLAKLAPDAVRAIKDTLKDGSHRDKMTAATVVLKAVGLHEDEKTTSDTQLTIVLPTGAEATTIEVPNETD